MADKDRHFTQGQIEQIANIFGDTGDGLTGTQIGFFLESCNIKDISPNITKRYRLFNAFAEAHNIKICWLPFCRSYIPIDFPTQ
jgi:hypothetical protein